MKKVKDSLTAKSMKQFANMRAKETQQKQGFYVIPENRAVDFSADSHKLKAIQRHEGVVKKPLAKKIEKEAKNRKCRIRGGCK